MKVDELRKRYLDFFRSKEHKAYSSDSLVPHNDPSLLFTGAGMNQFKQYFLGLKKDVKRATSCQKCLRTADLERVGKTAYHHTFFEMLGNFSFGDYFKEEAIAWGWEFVTKEMKLPKEKLWVSVFENDDEAFNIWKDKIGVPAERIVRMGPEDNFWPSNAPKDGPNGPCGPCSEIYVGEVPGKGVEIWNLVFTQFDRQSDGSLKDLPQRNIDTGMGLERAAAVLQGVNSNYEIDTFSEIRKDLKRLLKEDSNQIAHENAVMDHVRAIVFSIADGALPSNEGRGYVIRKLIRLGSEHLTKAGAKESGGLSKLVSSVARVMGATYPEIVHSEKNITAIIENEEKSYLKILSSDMSAKRGSKSPEEFAFMLYDTYGYPLDVIKEKFAKDQIVFNEEKFNQYLEEQRKRSRDSSKIAGEIFSKDDSFSLIEGLTPTLFEGYEKTSTTAKLLRIISKENVPVSELKKGEEGFLIFDRTPFYAESGGQVGDAGEIQGKNSKAQVLDTQWIEKCALHKVKVLDGEFAKDASCELKIDSERRADIMKNHTATHLLHSALRKTLGEHVKQSGSLVAADRLRFDFTHFNALGPEAILKIEDLVNGEVAKNISLDKSEMSKEEAVQKGAIAFFGEKYGDKVRVVTIGDFSKELCGGTHLRSTGEIGQFKIVSESSIQAGVRRIEAVTGRQAEKLAKDQESEAVLLAKEFGISQSELLPTELKALQEKLKKAKNSLLSGAANSVYKKVYADFQKTDSRKGVKVFVRELPGASGDILNIIFDRLKATSEPFVLFAQAPAADKLSFAVGASPDLVKKGFNSGQMVKEISLIAEGNGGGRPDFAIGGGKNLSKLAEAKKTGQQRIEESLSLIADK